MGEAGILGRDDHVELIDGQVLVEPRVTPPQAGTRIELNHMFFSLLDDLMVLSPHLPLVLGEFSEPQPDVALLKPPLEIYRRRHPRPEDVLLLIEVADSAAPYDRDLKIPLYAIAGIVECWIVDVRGNVIEVYTSPSEDGFRTVEQFRPGDRIAPRAFPTAGFAVSDILGTA